MNADMTTTAQDRAQQIRDGLAAVWDLLTAAYAAEDWKTLGYSSWEAYCIGEFQGRIPRLAKSERGGVVQELADHGMPIKAIAAATGIARNTVRKDLRTAEEQADGGQNDPSEERRQRAWAHMLAARAALDDAMDSINKIRKERAELHWARDNHPDPEVVETATAALRLIEHDDGTEITDDEHKAALGLAVATGNPSPRDYLRSLYNRP